MVTQVLFKREQKEDRRKENTSPTRSITIKLNAQEGYLKTRERLELNLNENVHVTPINFGRPIFDPTAGVA
jgi:hypothetical protein